MKKTIRILAAIVCVLAILASRVIVLTGCEYDAAAATYGTEADVAATQRTADKLQAAQPTPTDIEYSLERYNLIRRAYWVNGRREKANALPCPITLKTGRLVTVVLAVRLPPLPCATTAAPPICTRPPLLWCTRPSNAGTTCSIPQRDSSTARFSPT